MNERICSVRVLSCASISGTVSGTGSGTRAGSTAEDALAGAGNVSTGGAVAAGAAAVVPAGPAAACGSFEYAGKAKSNRLGFPPGANVTVAYISTGGGSL